MYIQTLKNLMTTRRLSPADIARLARVSRAAVCKWFHSPAGFANVETRSLIKLAQGLEIDPKELLINSAHISHMSTLFLWDRLYSSMEEFALAIVQRQLPALARLVQVMGFNSARKIIGNNALKLFPRYKKYIKPVRRKQLEILWPLYLSKN